MNHILLVGEDQVFHSRELHQNNDITHVSTTHEAISLLETSDFGAIIARDGSEILTHVRGQGKHTPFLNISHNESAVDCCGGHMYPEASVETKLEACEGLFNRNHDTDCL